MLLKNSLLESSPAFDNLSMLEWSQQRNANVFFKWRRRRRSSSCIKSLLTPALIGTLGNYDGDGGENVKKAIGLMGKTTTLHVHAFLSFLCCPCYTTTWNDQILSLFENGNGKAINSTISVWIRARSPLFSSNQNSLLLSNKANWDNREKV